MRQRIPGWSLLRRGTVRWTVPLLRVALVSALLAQLVLILAVAEDMRRRTQDIKRMNRVSAEMSRDIARDLQKFRQDQNEMSDKLRALVDTITNEIDRRTQEVK